jgi:hypothetical protein
VKIVSTTAQKTSVFKSMMNLSTARQMQSFTVSVKLSVIFSWNDFNNHTHNISKKIAFIYVSA